MKENERRAAAKAFAEYWKDRGYEKGESQPFWLSLLRDVLGVASPEQTIHFEEQVRLDHTSFIDGIIPSVPYHLLCLFYAAVALVVGFLVYKKNNHKFLYYV